ncbi:hypothetical protein J6590_034618 [Homalodisca vitripennis]|nr:hypothetical protein J6590_034618 [Homalodisca vitripennis]
MKLTGHQSCGGCTMSYELTGNLMLTIWPFEDWLVRGSTKKCCVGILLRRKGTFSNKEVRNLPYGQSTRGSFPFGSGRVSMWTSNEAINPEEITPKGDNSGGGRMSRKGGGFGYNSRLLLTIDQVIGSGTVQGPWRAASS